MFIFIVIILFVISFLLSLRSLKTFNEKPEIGDIKKSLDKDKIVFQSHSSSE